MGSIYTVVQYGNTPLNSGSLLEQNPILQIVRFSADRTLNYRSLHLVFVLILKLNRLTLHRYQVLQDTPCLYQIRAYHKNV